MPILSKRSTTCRDTCHPDLIKIINEAIKYYDFVVICGERNKEEQDKAFAMKVSKLKWPDSKHNKKPSLAFDAVPFPVDWNDIARFRQLAIHIKAAADKFGIKVRWGGDFSGKFKDYPHWELV